MLRVVRLFLPLHDRPRAAGRPRLRDRRLGGRLKELVGEVTSRSQGQTHSFCEQPHDQSRRSCDHCAGIDIEPLHARSSSTRKTWVGVSNVSAVAECSARLQRNPGNADRRRLGKLVKVVDRLAPAILRFRTERAACHRGINKRELVKPRSEVSVAIRRVEDRTRRR